MKSVSLLPASLLLASAATVTAAPAAPTSTASPSPEFHLVATVTSKQPHEAFQGSYLSSFHTGAGQSTIVTTADRDIAATFYLEDGALIQNSSYPFVVSILDQRPYLSDAPEEYKYVALNIGSPDAGTRPFKYHPKSGNVRLERDDFTFAVCNVNGTSPYFSVGPQSQLLWRSTAGQKTEDDQQQQQQATKKKPSKCADVVLHAVAA